MKITGVIVAVIMALAVFTVADASARSDDMKGDKMDRGMMSEKMAGHHMMTTEMMGMFKETLAIVRDMNHTPTAEQKKRLDEMIGRMDEMIKQHDEYMKNACDWKKKKMDRMKERKKDRMMNNPCAAKSPDASE